MATKKKAATESTVDPVENQTEKEVAKKAPVKKATKKEASSAEEKKEPEQEKKAKSEEKPAAKAKKTAKATTAAKAAETDAKEPKKEAPVRKPAKPKKESKDLATDLSKKRVEDMKYDEKTQVYGALDQSKDKIFRTQEARAKQAGDWMKEEFQILSAAVKQKKDHLLRVLITGRTKDEDYGPCMVARLCDKDKVTDMHRGYFRILIPIDFFVDLADEESMWAVDDKETSERYKNAIIDRFLDIKVDVVVFRVNEFERRALASRLDASQWLSQKYFKGGSTYDTRAYFHEGDVATGQVLAAMKDRLVVSVYGQDFAIRSKESSWLANSALYDEFRVGQMVDVKLLSIDNNYQKEVMGKKYNLTKIVGSIRQASMNPNQLFFNDYNEGDLYICRVKSRANHHVYVTVNDQIVVMCDEIPSGRIHEDAKVRITKKEIVKDKETGENVYRFYGNLINKDF